MKTVKLVDGTVYTVEEVIGSRVIHNGINRDSLLFLFNKEQSLEELQQKFTAENCTKVEIDVITADPETGEENVDVNIHEHYTIRTELGVATDRYVIGSNYADDTAQSYAFVRMVQTTEAERTLERHEQEIEDLIVAVLEG